MIKINHSGKLEEEKMDSFIFSLICHDVDDDDKTEGIFWETKIMGFSYKNNFLLPEVYNVIFWRIS